jgi:riboflavin synthase
VFTGLVEDLGTIVAVDATDDGARLTLDTPLAGQLGEGDSIAVNGVCLTAVGIDGDRFGADVMHETLRRSSLGDVEAGSRVNLELALRADARLGGHIMQGHVDGVGTVAAVREDGFARIVTIAAASDLLRYVVEKGSIAIDGISLTVARVDDAGFDVSLIPETLERTTLGVAEPGRTVNLEVDILAKYVEKAVKSFGQSPRSSLEELAQGARSSEAGGTR